MSQSDADIDELVDHLFRHQAGRLIAILTRIFGPEHLDLAEDVAQEALIKALELWPYRGIPENPINWLAQTAKNSALNRLKRDRIFADKLQQLVEPDPQPSTAEIDDVVRLMFVACHPALSSESRVALTLKTVAGLSVEQIARALLAQPTALAQRLVRAKRQIRELGLTFELPAEVELPGRLDSVLEVLYLLFNEGYSAHDGDDLIRGELCDEAIRLCRLLCNSHDLDQPHVHALLALMLLQAARLPARTDAGGELLTLEKQDRSLWDQTRLAEGIRALARSARGEQLTSYHLEAGVAACHASAASYQETDWRHILEIYDQLLDLNPSPVVALNRAVALSQCEGPEAGIRALDAVRGHPALERYYLLWATLARLHAGVNDVAQAAGYYRKALECACSAPERRFLESSLAALERRDQP